MQQKLISKLKANPFVLAPMAGITDHSFRSFMKELGAGVVVTELISATGLEYNSKRTKALMSFDQTQHPIGIQLFGENPEHLAYAAKQVEEMGADFVDLNFGCPVPKVVKKGAGSAMMKDLPAMKEVLRATVGAVKIPVTIKIRTGWDAETRNAFDVLSLAYDEGITWVAIHGRTRAQGYEGRADWDFIGDLKARAKLPIIGNGDIVTPTQAIERLRNFNLDGVMIGRGALKNPFIFGQSLALYQGSSGAMEKELVWAYNRLHHHLALHCEEPILKIQLKKFASWFSAGYPGAAQFRKNIFQADTVEKTLSEALDFLSNVKLSHEEGSSNEGFLMGGHG